MMSVQQHPHTPDASFDGGDLDCGSGLLLLIRSHIDPLPRGGLLEIVSTEISVKEDLPAWCRLTGNELVSAVPRQGKGTSFLVCKGALAERSARAPAQSRQPGATALEAARAQSIREQLPAPAPAPAIPPLAVMGVGSWPRPRWMVQAVHERLEGRLSEEEFQATADDAVRLCVDAQLRAGVDVITDGEQRRDSYASFVGGRLDNCQLIPLTDLLPLVDDPEQFQAELRALDVPCGRSTPPGRIRPARAQPADRRARGAVPRAAHRQTGQGRAARAVSAHAHDVDGVHFRQRLRFARGYRAGHRAGTARGARRPARGRRVDGAVRRAGALRGRVHGAQDAAAASCAARCPRKAMRRPSWLSRATCSMQWSAGFPRERVGMHICRGNWTPDESTCLSGDYAALVPTLRQIDVGTYFLELCTPRAGEIEVLRSLPDDRRIGVGVVNQKHARVESIDEILAKAERAVELFGAQRVLLNPDCGFATFADNPVASAALAQSQA